MKVLIISTTVYALPPAGYAGTEYLVYHLACGLANKGHKVSVVAPEGSNLPNNVELIPVGLREGEEQAYLKYKDRLEQDNWNAIVDATFQRWSLMSSIGRDSQLPIVNWHHTDVSIYQTPPPVRYPMWVGLSRSHAENMARHWGCHTRYIYNGIDLSFYTPDFNTNRGDRYLALGRYTPEKGFLPLIMMAKRLKIGLDVVGDTEIIASRDYMQRCFNEADGMIVRCMPGVSREETVKLYRKCKALLQAPQWEEPFSLITAEALACGTPIIGLRRGAFPELMSKKCGFIVDSIEEMEELIKKDTVSKIKPEECRRWAEQRFSIQRFVDDWERLLIEVAQGARW